MSDKKKLTTNAGCPVADNQNVMTAGPRGPQLLQDVWFLEKLAHFDREVIPERRMHAKGSGAYGTFTVTHDITRYTRAKIFSKVGKKTELGQVPFQVAAGHPQPDRRGRPRRSSARIARAISAISTRASSGATTRSGRSRSRSCQTQTPRRFRTTPST